MSKNPILILLRGNLTSQILPILFYPVITRLFSAHEFGIYSTILAIITTITVGTIVKLDQALPIVPEKEKKRIIRLGFWVNIFVSIVVFTVLSIIIIFHKTEILNIQTIFLIAVTIFINGCSNMLIGLNVSLGNFKINATYQILRSVLLTLFQILFGVIGFLKFGLIIAFLISQVVTLIYLIFIYKKELEKLFDISELSNDFVLLKTKYIDFPKYLTPSSLIKTFGVNLPSMLFTISYGISFAGMYGLVTRAFMTPLYMVSISIAQPFLKNLSDAQASPDDIKTIVLKAFKLLTVISIFPISLFSFNMEYLFGKVFSEEWIQAGKLAVFLLPWILLNFILSPISHVYTITRTQRNNLLFNIASIVLEVSVILVSQSIGLTFFEMITVFGMLNAGLAIVQLWNIFKIIRLERNYLISRLLVPMITGMTISLGINTITNGLIAFTLASLIVLIYYLLAKNELKEVINF